jgi:HlyD family secretion protein
MSVAMDRRVVRRRLLPRRMLAPTLAAVVLLAILCTALLAYRGDRNVRIPASTLTAAKVERGVFHDIVPLRGKAVARDVVYIDSLEGGRVERIAVVSGDVVTAGQPLVEFGNTSLQLEVIDREAMLIQQINSLRASQVDLERVRITNETQLADLDYDINRVDDQLQRRSTPATRNFTAEEERESLKRQLEHLRRLRLLVQASNLKQESLRTERLPEIDDSLRKLQDNLTITRRKLDSLLVRAPVSGRVSGFDLVSGQICSKGQRIAQITPNTGFKIVAKLDEFYLGRVASGQRALLEQAGEMRQLTLTRVAADVTEGQFTIELSFDKGSPAGLLPGQSLDGQLYLGEDRVTTFIPAGAFLEQTAGRWIFAVSADGSSALRRQIQVGRRNARQLEVMDGLRVGESVIVSDYRAFEKADSISIER